MLQTGKFKWNTEDEELIGDENKFHKFVAELTGTLTTNATAEQVHEAVKSSVATVYTESSVETQADIVESITETATDYLMTAVAVITEEESCEENYEEDCEESYYEEESDE